MVRAADLVEHRLDLDGVDVRRPQTERRLHVVARAGADDEHVLECLAAGVAVQEVRQRVPRADLRTFIHLLVADIVGDQVAVRGVVFDLVVGRPDHL